jgi:hypothetical protein
MRSSSANFLRGGLVLLQEFFTTDPVTVDIFVINMVIQVSFHPRVVLIVFTSLRPFVKGSFMLCALATISIKIFGCPLLLRIRASKSTAGGVNNHVSVSLLRYINPMLVDSQSGYAQLFVLLMMANAILVCLRILWFVMFVGGMGWWGGFVCLLLMVGHYVVPLSNLAIISSHVSSSNTAVFRR